MTDRIFDVEITITKTVRVRVPPGDDITYPGEDIADIAEEFAMGGKSSWPEYVISEDEDWQCESVREVPRSLDSGTQNEHKARLTK